MFRSRVLPILSLCFCLAVPSSVAQNSRLSTLFTIGPQGLSHSVINIDATVGRLAWSYRVPLYAKDSPLRASWEARYNGRTFTAAVTLDDQGFKRGQVDVNWALEALLLQSQARATFKRENFANGVFQFRIGQRPLNLQGQIDLSVAQIKGLRLASQYQISGQQAVLSGSVHFAPLNFRRGRLQYQAAGDAFKLTATALFTSVGVSKKQLDLSLPVRDLFQASGSIALMNTGIIEGQLGISGTWLESYVNVTATFPSSRPVDLLVNLTAMESSHSLNAQVQLNTSTGLSWADVEADVDFDHFKLLIGLTIGSVGGEEGRMELETSIGNVSLQNETIFTTSRIQSSHFQLGISL